MDLAYENRAKFNIKTFCSVLECYITPFILFGPAAFFTGAINPNVFFRLLLDIPLALTAVLAFVILLFYGTVVWVSLVKTWGVDMSFSLKNYQFVFKRNNSKVIVCL